MKILLLCALVTVLSVIKTSNPEKVVYNVAIRVDSSRVEWTKIIREPDWKQEGDTFNMNCNQDFY